MIFPVVETGGTASGGSASQSRRLDTAIRIAVCKRCGAVWPSARDWKCHRHNGGWPPDFRAEFLVQAGHVPPHQEYIYCVGLRKWNAPKVRQPDTAGGPVLYERTEQSISLHAAEMRWQLKRVGIGNGHSLELTRTTGQPAAARLTDWFSGRMSDTGSASRGLCPATFAPTIAP